MFSGRFAGSRNIFCHTCYLPSDSLPLRCNGVCLASWDIFCFISRVDSAARLEATLCFPHTLLVLHFILFAYYILDVLPSRGRTAAATSGTLHRQTGASVSVKACALLCLLFVLWVAESILALLSAVRQLPGWRDTVLRTVLGEPAKATGRKDSDGMAALYRSTVQLLHAWALAKRTSSSLRVTPS
jgi:hypothetical protein